MNNLTFQETPIMTRYFPETSSINLGRSIVYGFGILKFWLHNAGLAHFKQFEPLVKAESAISRPLP